MLEGDFVAIGWPELGNLRRFAKRPAQLQQHVRQTYPDLSNRRADYISGVATMFVDEVRKGDYAVAALGVTNLGIARVTGPYRFDERPTPTPHQRRVEWVDEREWRSPVPLGRHNPEGLQRTLTELHDPVTIRAVLEHIVTPIPPAAGAVLRKNADASALLVEDVPVEQQYTIAVQVHLSDEPRVLTRREHRLVLAFKRYIEGLGDEVTRKRITIPGDRRCETDLFNATRKQLFEAKDEASRDKIRLAIGQLADYMRFLADDVEAAVLVPNKPSADLLGLLESQGITAVWAELSGFRDNRRGQFV